MSLLKNMTSDGIEAQEDRLGGFSLKTTGLYDATVALAYITTATSGAMALNLSFKVGNGDYRENAIYFTNKAGENFYFTKDDKGNPTTKKAQLPGFNLINNLCRLAIGKELSQLDTEDKVVKIYDSTEKKEVPKSVPVIVELIGAPITLAIVEQMVNKTEKNDNTGNYDALAESRDENVIEHFFHQDTKATANEMDAYIKAEAEGKPKPELGAFAAQWDEKYTGKKRDKRTIKDGQSAPKSGRPSTSGSAPAATGAKATNSLFNRSK